MKNLTSFILLQAAMDHIGRVFVYGSNDDDNPGEGGYQMKSRVCVSIRDIKTRRDN